MSCDCRGDLRIDKMSIEWEGKNDCIITIIMTNGDTWRECGYQDDEEGGTEWHEGFKGNYGDYDDHMRDEINMFMYKSWEEHRQ